MRATKGELNEWVRREQAQLWHELDEAIRCALNGVWSIKAGNVASRIVTAAQLVGPTPHGEVLWVLVAGGIYEAVLDAGEVKPDLPPDEREWARLDALMQEWSGTRATIRPRMAATLEAVRRDAASIASA